ncbi:hypothetical protein J7L60_01855 [Candidatus Bathyarchaeota archaeon]|nr:hypothetical protein [Candidatus Bathyarchaeota archaeon]
MDGVIEELREELAGVLEALASAVEEGDFVEAGRLRKKALILIGRLREELESRRLKEVPPHVRAILAARGIPLPELPLPLEVVYKQLRVAEEAIRRMDPRGMMGAARLIRPGRAEEREEREVELSPRTRISLIVEDLVRVRRAMEALTLERPTWRSILHALSVAEHSLSDAIKHAEKLEEEGVAGWTDDLEAMRMWISKARELVETSMEVRERLGRIPLRPREVARMLREVLGLDIDRVSSKALEIMGEASRLLRRR